MSAIASPDSGADNASNASVSGTDGNNAGVVDVTLDLRGTPCPINFVRTKLQLQKMEAGQRLEVWIDSGEPTEQVPDSLAMAGFPVEALIDQGEYCALRVCKPGDGSQ